MIFLALNDKGVRDLRPGLVLSGNLMAGQDQTNFPAAIINHNACIELHPCFSLLCHAEEDEHVVAIAMIVCHSERTKVLLWSSATPMHWGRCVPGERHWIEVCSVTCRSKVLHLRHAIKHDSKSFLASLLSTVS